MIKKYNVFTEVKTLYIAKNIKAKNKKEAIKLIENSENKGDFENEEGETYKTELVKGLDK